MTGRFLFPAKTGTIIREDCGRTKFRFTICWGGKTFPSISFWVVPSVCVGGIDVLKGEKPEPGAAILYVSICTLIGMLFRLFDHSNTTACDDTIIRTLYHGPAFF